MRHTKRISLIAALTSAVLLTNVGRIVAQGKRALRSIACVFTSLLTVLDCEPLQRALRAMTM